MIFLDEDLRKGLDEVTKSRWDWFTAGDEMKSIEILCDIEAGLSLFADRVAEEFRRVVEERKTGTDLQTGVS